VTRVAQVIFYLTGVLFVIAPIACFAECEVLDPDQGSVFITFEKTAPVKLDGKDRLVDGVILQLHNNSNCSIIITTGTAGNFYKPLPPNPTPMQVIKREIDWVLPDGALVPFVQYKYQTRRGIGRSVGGDMFFGFELMGGRHLKFEVPFIHLDPSFIHRVDVDFDYVWETTAKRGKQGNVTNTAAFWVGSLPEALKREIRKAL